MKALRTLLLALIGLAVIVLFMSVYIVDENEVALKFQLGKVVESNIGPGLHFKMPIVNSVRKFDNRIRTLEEEASRFLTSEMKNLIVDSFVKWRIDDASRFYTTVGGDPVRANQRVSEIVRSGLRTEFGKRTVQDVIAGERRQVMEILTAQATEMAQPLGIRIIDVRVQRVDLPADVSESVYQRMSAERQRVALDFRARGAEAAERIRADADRQRTVILAEAYRDAEQIRGEGDAEAAETYAQAYEQDPEFFSFYRSLGAYRNSFDSQDDLLLLSPDSSFFRFFGEPGGGQ